MREFHNVLFWIISSMEKRKTHKKIQQFSALAQRNSRCSRSQTHLYAHTITIQTHTLQWRNRAQLTHTHKTQWLESLKTSLLLSVINRLLAKESCLTPTPAIKSHPVKVSLFHWTSLILVESNTSQGSYGNFFYIAKRPDAYMHWLDKPRIRIFCINISATWHYEQQSLCLIK